MKIDNENEKVHDLNFETILYIILNGHGMPSL